MSFSDTNDQAFLDAYLTDNTTQYLALSTTTPTKAGANVTEPSGNGYARVSIYSLLSRSGSTIANTADIEFPEATGSWGTITYGVIYSALTSGTMLWFGALATSKEVVAGNVPTIATGGLTLTAA